jgi:ribosomal protein L31E
MERTYTIPLRPGYRNAPAYYRTNKAVRTLRLFLVRHMKAKEADVRIGQHLNELLWKHGIKNPPARVTVNVKKDDKGLVFAELAGKEYTSAVKPQARREEAKGLKERLQSVVGKKDDEEEKPKVDVRKTPLPKPENVPKHAMEE